MDKSSDQPGGYRSDTGPFALIPVWVLCSSVSARAIQVYGILAVHADYETGETWPRRKTLAAEIGVSLPTLDKALGELVKLKALTITPQYDVLGNRTPNLYCVKRVLPGGQESEATPSQGTFTAKNETQVRTKEGPKDIVALPVKAAWLANAPPLFRHRDSYFDEDLRRRITKAAAKYDPADIVAAIDAYAAVLRSPDHFFKYRWTLGDFLRRGLDKFVPEAEPLDNYRRREISDRMTPTEIATQYDYLEGDEDAPARHVPDGRPDPGDLPALETSEGNRRRLAPAARRPRRGDGA